MNIDSIFFYWEQRKLNQFSKYITSNKTVSDIISDGIYDLYDANNIIGKINNGVIKEEYITIIKDGSGVGKVRRLPKNTSFIGTMGGIVGMNSNIDFIYCNLLKTDFTKEINGATIPHVYYSSYGNNEYYIPKIEEQNKIGLIFNNIDNLITLHQRKFNYILSHKLEIKLFFFKITKNVWEQRKLGDISFSYSGGTPNVGNNSYYGGSIPFIRSGEIKEKHTELFLTEEGFKNSSSKMVEKGDILYALYGATSGEVSISLINGAINQAILAIRPQCPYNNYFISQWLKKEKNNITSTYLQGGQGNLSGEIVKNLEINFPKQNIEQDKIGEIFTNLDNLITLHQHKELKRRNDNNDNLRW